MFLRTKQDIYYNPLNLEVIIGIHLQNEPVMQKENIEVIIGIHLQNEPVMQKENIVTLKTIAKNRILLSLFHHVLSS